MAFKRFVLASLICAGIAIVTYMVASRLADFLAWGFTQTS